MISLIQPLAAGNALRIFLEPIAGAVRWRVLRKLSDSFLGPDDQDALLVADGQDKILLDISGLVNGTLYHYRPYYSIDGRWRAGPVVTGTPNATYEDLGGDVLSIVRERLDLGLQEEVRRGVLCHDNGHIKVLTAPPQLDDTVWPVVTVHLNDASPGERAVGESLDEGAVEGEEQWETEGWLERTQLTIMAWSLNPDERKELRRALARLVKINLPIFDFAGMVEIEFSQQDTEDFASFGVPVYQVLCTFSCLAPSQVGVRVAAVKEVFSTFED